MVRAGAVNTIHGMILINALLTEDRIGQRGIFTK
jgi:hypothetical protein